MADGLEVTGGAGGVAADVADLRTCAQVADDLASHVGDVAREVGQLALRPDVAATVPLSPATATRAQADAVEVATRLGRRLVELQARAAALRTVATATETADGAAAFVGDRWDTASGLVLLGGGLAESLWIYGQHLDGAGREAVRTGHDQGWAAFADAMRDAPGDAFRATGPEASALWGDLLLERPEVVNGVVGGLVGGVDVVARSVGRSGTDHREVVTGLTRLGELTGYLDDPRITVGPGVRSDGGGGDAALVPGGVADLVANQMTLMDVAKDDRDGSRLRVIEVPGASGSSWIVQVPGTQAMAGGPNPSDMVSNLYLSGLQDAALLDAIGTALDAHGVGDDPILIAGHSQGGIAAVNFAAQGQDRGYNVTHAVAVGSPIATVEVPAEVQVLALEHDNDGVVRLDASTNPDRPNVTTVVADVGVERFDDPLGPHGSGIYLETAEAVDRSTDASVTTFLDGATPFLSGSDEPGAQVHDHPIRRTP